MGWKYLGLKLQRDKSFTAFVTLAQFLMPPKLVDPQNVFTDDRKLTIFFTVPKVYQKSLSITGHFTNFYYTNSENYWTESLLSMANSWLVGE